MKTFHWLAAAALAVTMPAFATATPTTYSFDNPASSTLYNPYTTGPTYAGLQGYGTDTTTRATGSYFGNSLTFGATSGGVSGNSAVTISAYAGTGLATGTSMYGGSNGTIENAVVTQYNTTGGPSLAITSRNTGTANGTTTTTSGATTVTGNFVGTEFSCSGTTSCTNSASENAMDNANAFETLLLKFQSAVSITSLTLGFPDAGASNNATSDATILYYKGSGDPTAAMLGQTYAQLVSSGAWGYVDANDISGSTCGSVTDCETIAVNGVKSTYWMIGAYIPTLPNNAAGYDGSNDYIKLRSITTAVPEPTSIALLGIAGLGMIVQRRRRAARAA